MSLIEIIRNCYVVSFDFVSILAENLNVKEVRHGEKRLKSLLLNLLFNFTLICSKIRSETFATLK